MLTDRRTDGLTDRRTDRRTSSIHKLELLCNPAKNESLLNVTAEDKIPSCYKNILQISAYKI